MNASAKKLRDAQTFNQAVIAFTAFAMKGDEARMRAAGCDGYIAKPINVAEFAQTVRATLNRVLVEAASLPGQGAA